MAAASKLVRSVERLGSDPRHCVFRHLSRASRLVSSSFEEAFAEAPVSPGQFTLLMTLASGGPLSVGQLASRLALDPTTVPRVLRPLLDARLVATRAGTDRRVRLIEVTDAGQEALIATLPHWERAQARALEALAPVGWDDLRHRLAALRDGLVDREQAG